MIAIGQVTADEATALCSAQEGDEFEPATLAVRLRHAAASLDSARAAGSTAPDASAPQH